MAARDVREMELIAKCLDFLTGGELPSLGNILMQRFKSLELRQLHRDLKTANHLEVHSTPSGLATPAEIRAATRQLHEEAKIRAIQGQHP